MAKQLADALQAKNLADAHQHEKLAALAGKHRVDATRRKRLADAVWRKQLADAHQRHQLADAPVFLRRKQVEARTGLSRSTIYLHIQQGTFPAPVHLGVRAVGWIESEITAWIADRIETSRKGAA